MALSQAVHRQSRRQSKAARLWSSSLTNNRRAPTLAQFLSATAETGAMCAPGRRPKLGPLFGGCPVALVVDQMEELFSSDRVTEPQRIGFLQALPALARSGHVWIIDTMRSDFYPSCAEVPELAALKAGAGRFDLLPPTAQQLAQMIGDPARAVGPRFEEKLTGATAHSALPSARRSRKRPARRCPTCRGSPSSAWLAPSRRGSHSCSANCACRSPRRNSCRKCRRRAGRAAA